MIFLGLDIGSSGCKCIAISEDGTLRASCGREYPKQPGQIGLDAEVLFSHVCEVILGCSQKIGDKSQIVSVTVSSFGESFVPVDRSGRTLSDIALYTDNWGKEETEHLQRTVPGMSRITGAAPNSLYALPKMMWLLKDRPDIADRIWKFLQIADFIIYRLCGEAVIDYSLSCRSLAFDIDTKNWSGDVLSAAGIRADQLSSPVPAGSIAGTLRSDLSATLGLPSHTKIVVGAHDQVASAVGAGALRPGEAVVGTGSVECITPVYASPILEENFLRQNYVCIPHAVPGNYVTYAFTLSGGSLLPWYRDRLAPHLKSAAAEKNRSIYELLDDTCPASSSDVMVIPHFGGTGTPELNPSALGTVTGLNMSTGLPEIYRAILEGLCFELCYNREQLSRFGISFSSVYATGGGAKSPLWLRLKADILGIPVAAVETADAGAMGGAMMAAVSLGTFTTLTQASEVFVKIKEPVVPDIRESARYAEKYEKYKRVRKALLPE